MKKQYGIANHGVLFTGGDLMADGITPKPRTSSSFKLANEARYEMNERVGVNGWEVVEVYNGRITS